MPPGRGRVATGTGRHGGASVQVDVEKSIALAREYEIFHLPALMLFVDGHFHAGIHSPLLPEKLQQAVEKALTLPAEEAP